VPKHGASQSAREIAARLRTGKDLAQIFAHCVSRTRDAVRLRFARSPFEAASRSLSEFTPLLLRVGVSFCFYGHGTFGFIYKESWVPFFSYFGISREWARFLEFVIGSIDYFVATLALLIPFPALFAYAAFWGAWTAFLRPLTGLGWWELFDRAGNFGVALAVLLLYFSVGFTNRQFKPSFPRLDSERKVVVVTRVLQITTALFLLGHAGLAIGQRKALLAHHIKRVAAMVGTHDPLQYLLRVSGLVDVSLMFVVLCYPASRILLLETDAPLIQRATLASPPYTVF